MFSIVNKKKIFFAVPAVIIIIGIICFAINSGFNTDIDFTGGYTMTVEVLTGDDVIKTATPDTATGEATAPDADAQTEAAAPVEGEDVTTDANATTNETPAEGEAAQETKDEITQEDLTQAVQDATQQEENKPSVQQTTVSGEDGVVTSDKTAPLASFTYNENEIRDILKTVSGVQVSSVVSSEDAFIIKMNDINSETADAVKTALADKYGQIRVISEDKVSATMGAELWTKSLIAIFIAIVLMLVYITIRFELLSGLSAIVALAHDVLIILSIYAIFQLPVNTSFIAAVLTILGYSINATIVIFDRVRENRKLDKCSFGETVDKSIFQSMTRSINTSVTTLLTIGMVYILGVESVKQFALPIIIGIICGTYSSIFVSGPFWAMIKGDKKR